MVENRFLFFMHFFLISQIFSLDKALNSLGYKFGYALPKSQLPNPINIVMVYAQRVSKSDLSRMADSLYGAPAGNHSCIHRC